MTYPELERFLFARARAGMKLGLERMERALAELDHPERAAPVVHVAGTNGKGSVCAFVERVCREAGLKTALYTSPHLERFGERFRFGGVPLGEVEIVRRFDELQERIPWAFAEGPEALTFFELVTLLGFASIAAREIDVAVIEVGLGGRFDATNVVVPRVACVTPIDFDHREFLGDTLAQIAWEKGGILKPGVPAASARQEAEALAVLETIARDVGAPLSVEGRDFALDGDTFRSPDGRLDGVRVGLRGTHQRSNAAVALRALELAELGVRPPEQRRGIALADWPGRLETVHEEPEVVLDGAHNPHAARALQKAARELFASRPVQLVLGMLADKDAREVVALLAPIASRILVTAPKSPRALAAEKLASLAHEKHRDVETVPDAKEAIDRAIARARPNEVVLVAGSLYLVGEVRAHLRGGEAGGPSESLR